MISNKDISVVIPVYNRSLELEELFQSILELDVFPGELVICEDGSPEREKIRLIVSRFKNEFSKNGIDVNYIENDRNIGFDKNLRKCIEVSSRKWAFIIGNDDVLLPKSIDVVVSYVNKNDKVDIISRAFIRFNNDIKNPLGLSSISSNDTIYSLAKHSSSKYVFRTCGFIGGLVVNVNFAKKLTTNIYDGGLYYQIYLACHAFCNGGIGYISTPLVGGRADNPPLFGSADDESSIHIPGGYTAKGRAKMWSSVLTISKDVGDLYSVNLLSDIKNELKIRQSFHIFEMNAGVSIDKLNELKIELSKIDLFWSPIPIFLFMLNCIFGKKSRIFYQLTRKLLQ